MLRIEMLPASCGDGLWIEYGSARAPHRLLIDGGLSGDGRVLTARARKAGAKCRLELVVITHIDADHIGAPLRFLDELPAGVEIGDVWFNGRRHLPGGVLSTTQGEEVSALLEARKLPWNAAWRGRAVVVPAKGALPVKKLPGGATITLLSPGPAELLALARQWDQEIGRGGGTLGAREAPSKARPRAGALDVEALAAAPFEPDGTAPNGSSIAFLLEHAGRRVLFGADAHVGVLLRSLARLPGKGPLGLAALKLSHHGSARSLSVDLLAAVDCRRFLVSTNGRQHHHPDREAIARIVRHAKGATLYFNYRTRHNLPWDDARLRAAHGYQAVYPAEGEEGLSVDLPEEG
jgi:beta-lactamase superfamily II metal-dependent hydrolase